MRSSVKKIRGGIIHILAIQKKTNLWQCMVELLPLPLIETTDQAFSSLVRSDTSKPLPFLHHNFGRVPGCPNRLKTRVRFLRCGCVMCRVLDDPAKGIAASCRKIVRLPQSAGQPLRQFLPVPKFSFRHFLHVLPRQGLQYEHKQCHNFLVVSQICGWCSETPTI